MQSCVDTLNTTPYSAVNFTRGTYADGTILQDKVFKRFRDSDMYLASAIDTNSTNVSAIYEELEHLKAASDVIAVYGSYSAFQTQSAALGYLSDKDIIKVLNDESSQHTQTYYQYSTTTSAWSIIGSLDPYYNITQTDAISSYLNDRINTKVDQTAFDTYSASVSTQLTTLSSSKVDKSVFSAYQTTVTQQFNAVSSDLNNKLYTSAFNSITSTWDITPYSGSDNVSVKNHVISLSGKSELVGDNKCIAVVEQGSNTVISAMKDFVDLTTVTSAFSGTYKHVQTASSFFSNNNEAIIALTQTENGNVSAKFGSIAPNVNLTAIGTAGTVTSATSSYLAVQSATDPQSNTKTFNLSFDPSDALTSWWRIRGSTHENHLAHAIVKDLASEGGASYGTIEYPTSTTDTYSAKYMLLPYITESTQGATFIPVYIAPGTITWRDDYRYAHVKYDSTTSSAWHVTFKKVDVLPDTLENDIYYLL